MFTKLGGFIEVPFSVHIGLVSGSNVRSLREVAVPIWSVHLPAFTVAVSVAKSIMVHICCVSLLQPASLVRLLTKRGPQVEDILLIDCYSCNFSRSRVIVRDIRALRRIEGARVFGSGIVQ